MNAAQLSDLMRRDVIELGEEVILSIDKSLKN
jgi:hypothetical protein